MQLMALVGYWMLSGLRGHQNEIDEQVLEAMDNLWALAHNRMQITSDNIVVYEKDGETIRKKVEVSSRSAVELIEPEEE